MNGYTITGCKQCRLVFVRERVEPAELDAFYAGGHDEVYEDDNTECLAFYYRALKREIERRVPGKGRILDVGCAGGWFLGLMEGWECYGCEICLRDFEVAHRIHGDRVRHCDFADFPAEPGSLDVIAMQDVFDHLPDPAAALDRCRRMLRPGGLLVIKVHDISCLYAKLTGSNFYALIPPSHLFYYCKQSLSTMLTNSGFQVTGARHIGHILKLQSVFQRLSRGDVNSSYHRIYRRLRGSWPGKLKLYKNLHDIITVFAAPQA